MTIAPSPESAPPARYAVDTSSALHRVVRVDGLPLGAPAPDRAIRALQRARRAATEAAEGRLKAAQERQVTALTLRRRELRERGPKPPDDAAPNGEELRRQRDALGVSQYAVAAAAGVSRGQIAEIERGRRTNIYSRISIAQALASLGGEQ